MLLTRFPTTLEQDRRALEGGPAVAAEGGLPEGGPHQLAPDVRTAVQLRAEKKAVLSEVLQDIGHRIRVSYACMQVGVTGRSSSSSSKVPCLGCDFATAGCCADGSVPSEDNVRLSHMKWSTISNFLCLLYFLGAVAGW